MSPSAVSLLVRLRVRPEHAETFVTELRGALEFTRAQPGCLAFLAGRSVGDPTVIVLHEVWASQEDLDRHHGRPEMKERMASYELLLLGPPEVTPLRPIS